MRFELTVALKYLLPKWRQLSVSIISLISVLVISLVVWLVVLFLSVTDGIEKKWVEELVALNAHLRMSPTEAYYNSYYYQVDGVSLESNYTTKTIGQKLAAPSSDPYNPRLDMELSLDFPTPDRHEDGRLKDPVKEGLEAIQSLAYGNVRTQEYEVGFGNLRLHLLREGPSSGEAQQTFLTQVSYVANHDVANPKVASMILPPSAADYNNLLEAIVSTSESPLGTNEPAQDLNAFLQQYFQNLIVKELKTTSTGFVLDPSLFPKKGRLQGIGIVRYGQIERIVVPKIIQHLPSLEERLSAFGFKTLPIQLLFEEGQIFFSNDGSFAISPSIQIVLDEKIPFKAELLSTSLSQSKALSDLIFHIEGMVQQIPISGSTHYQNLEIASAEKAAKNQAGLEPFWIYRTDNGSKIPDKVSSPLGEGLLIAKYFQNNGVRLGDRGYLSYYAQAGSSTQEQRIPVYVAGFYDPGMVPVGNKLIFVNPHVTAILRGNTTVADPMLGNGINIWLKNIHDVAKFKEDLIKSLEVRGIKKYWTVQSFHDYDFTRPILEQLQSDKNLFTLIAVIILIVACSNIISMLILLVNDKKKEIGILQSMGASPQRIAFIFGFCGFVMGFVSCIIGITAAVITLKNLQALVDLLSFLQGREAFQAAFYGSSLPNSLSYSALILVAAATLIISLLAGIIPAVKASKIRPTEILKSEG